MLMGDRSTRRAESVAVQSTVDAVREALVEESRSKENLEAQYTSDINYLSERIESLARGQVEKVQDLCDQFKCLATNVNKNLQDTTRSVLQVQSLAETSQIEASSRLKVLEDRAFTLESRVGEVGNRQALQFDELQTQQRKQYLMTEQLRLEDRDKVSALRPVSEAASGSLPLPNGSLSCPAGTSSLTQPFSSSQPCSPSPVQEAVEEVGKRPPSPIRLISAAGSVRYTRSQRERSISPPAPIGRTSQTAPQAMSPAASPLCSVGHGIHMSPLELSAPHRSLSPVPRYRSVLAPAVPSIPNVVAGPQRGLSLPRHRPSEEAMLATLQRTT
jgi:hypothetical protein